MNPRLVKEAVMRTVLALTISALLSVGALAGHNHVASDMKVFSARDIAEKLDGKDTRATTYEVTIEPAKGSAPHRHPGPVFAYILEGEYEWAIKDRPARRLKAGDTFYEPAMCLHRVSRNPGKTVTRLLVVMLHPRDAEELVIPERVNETHP
jgi:quercetin dioxygenase-like cupin family protein